MTNRIRPIDFDRDTGPFFAAAKDHRLVYRACTACGRGTHLPTDYCSFCGAAAMEWRDAVGRGSLFTWTTVVHQVHPAYPAPYTLVVVALEEAPEVRLVGALPGQPMLSAGQPMTVWFEDIGEGQVLPQWRPADKAS